MTDMRTLTLGDFKKLEGAAFDVRSVEGGLALSLVEVKAMGQGEREGGAFSVLWQGPAEPILGQSMYTLYQPDLGEHQFFLVPVAQKDAGIQYEAVFT